MEDGKQTRRCMTQIAIQHEHANVGQRWTCESCEHYDDGYCFIWMKYKEEDDYCKKWSDMYDDDD